MAASKSYYSHASPYYQQYHPVHHQYAAYSPYTQQQAYYNPYTTYSALPVAPVVAAPVVNTQMATAALAYMKATKSADSCAGVAEAYLTALLSGVNADQEASLKYQGLYRSAGFASSGSAACKAAEAAYLSAVSVGQEPIGAAATAYIANSPAASNDDPCAQAGQAYFTQAANGVSQKDALNAATKGFMSAWNNLEAQGKSVFDGACGEAVNAYIKTL